MEMIKRISLQQKIERVIARPRKIYQTSDGKHFNIDIELQTCIHGYLSRRGRQPASLLIFGVQFASLRKQGTFKRMHLRLDFQDSEGVKPATSPEIICHAPFELERQNITEINVQQTDGVRNSVFANINLAGGKSGGSKTISHSKVENYKDLYFDKGASATVANERGRHSGIWWNVKQSTNPHAKDDAGIESNYRFAVLLTRKNDSEFQVQLRLLVDAGWRHRVENHFSRGITVTGDNPDLNFSPVTRRYEGNCTGINRKRLGRFKDRAELKRLTL